MLRLKNKNGIFKNLSPAAFKKQFGVEYTERLVVDESCSRIVQGDEESPLCSHGEPSHSCSGTQVDCAPFEQDGERSNTCFYLDLVRQNYLADIYIGKVSDEVGYGIFAGSDIAQNAMLGEYTGLARIWKTSDATNAYIFSYIENTIIDARKFGNAMRFVNHSAANANACDIMLDVDGTSHIILAAKDNIRQDEQILFDYGENYWRYRHSPRDLC